MNTYRNRMIFRSILHLSMRGIPEKYQLPLIRWPTWSLALANFNTPSQLGRTPSADPYVRLYYLCHQFPALLYSAELYFALLCSTMKKKNWSRMSHTILHWPEVSFIWRECHITLTDSKSVLLIPDQYHKRVSQTIHTDPRSVSMIPDQWRSS